MFSPLSACVFFFYFFFFIADKDRSYCRALKMSKTRVTRVENNSRVTVLRNSAEKRIPLTEYTPLKAFRIKIHTYINCMSVYQSVHKTPGRTPVEDSSKTHRLKPFEYIFSIRKTISVFNMFTKNRTLK